MHRLYVGFKGVNNTSYQLVSQFRGEKIFLTNSFSGLSRDIEKLNNTYSSVFLFGVDKTLVNSVRIELCAEYHDRCLSSALSVDKITTALCSQGLTYAISDSPTHYLCNDAYFRLLEKNNCKVILIHIPSIKNMNKTLFTQIIDSIETSDTYDEKSDIL